MGKYGIHFVPDAANKYVGDCALKLDFASQKGERFIRNLLGLEYLGIHQRPRPVFFFC